MSACVDSACLVNLCRVLLRRYCFHPKLVQIVSNLRVKYRSMLQTAHVRTTQFVFHKQKRGTFKETKKKHKNLLFSREIIGFDSFFLRAPFLLQLPFRPSIYLSPTISFEHIWLSFMWRTHHNNNNNKKKKMLSMVAIQYRRTYSFDGPGRPMCVCVCGRYETLLIY